MSKAKVMNLLTMAAVAAVVVYASNNDLPVIGRAVQDTIGR